MQCIISRDILSLCLWYIRRYFADGCQRQKNQLDEKPILDIYRMVKEDGYMEIDICFPLK